MSVDESAASRILLEEREQLAPSVPIELVRRVYQIEARVQFDQQRTEAAQQIHVAVTESMEKEALGE